MIGSLSCIHIQKGLLEVGHTRCTKILHHFGSSLANALPNSTRDERSLTLCKVSVTL